ncbi:CYTH and CHAD domain-containing protein [Belnapia moabensis]|uniref:CYTH and CHAD domain-containing protein n=1 Tax=Belnapia moabensis TaxID=365533 RepID=UPI0012ED99C1|nr:CHAD domain-containing protein [Belnapia moabensis]
MSKVIGILVPRRSAVNSLPCWSKTVTKDTVTIPAELEVKFLMPRGTESALAGYLGLHGDGIDEAVTRQEVTTYFDTPEQDLSRHGATLRVRRTESGRVQTLKMRSEGSPAFARGEWEWTLGSDNPEPERLASTPLVSILGGLGQLEPVFTTDVRRTTRTFQLDGALIEAAIDLGSVRAGSAAEEICELELELKGGKVAQLYKLAATLRAELPLTLGAESKADRGWRLRTGHPRAPEKSVEIALAPDVTSSEAIRRILNGTLANLMANLPAAVAGQAAGVHNMRIAIRRLRAALALFHQHLAGSTEARLTAELRRLGRVLGEARDWDVFCTETLPKAAEDGVAKPLLEIMRVRAGAARADAHSGLSAELAGSALTALVLDLAAWAEDPAALAGSPDGGALHTPLKTLAPALEARLERKARRRGKHIRQRSEEELHSLRKALKRLRYGIEFLAPLHHTKRVNAYLKGCKALQEHLGVINDAAVAVSLAERLSAKEPSLTLVTAALKAWTDHRGNEARQHLRKAWRTFKEASLPT